MKLIVGLGNPGKKYQGTRHNLGFEVINSLSKEFCLELKPSSKLLADIAKTTRNKQQIILAKPTTMMNLSGQSVQAIVSYYKLKPKDVWVVVDDLNLDFGVIRTRIGGSSGGHNGLQSIIDRIGNDFVRVRIGIKNQYLQKTSMDSFVLKNFSSSEAKKLNSIISQTTQCIIAALEDGIEHTTIK